MNGNKQSTSAVASIETMKKWVWVVVAAAVLVGCEPNDKITPVGGGSGSAGSHQESDTPDPKEPHKVDPEEIQRQMEEAHTPTADVRIAENAPGWEKAQAAPTTVEDTLGKKIDDALANLPPAMAAVQMEISDRGSLLRSAPKILIQDRSRFEIQYALPETEADVNRLTGDGSKRVRLEGGKVTDLPPLGASGSATKAMDRKQIEAFAKRMPGDGFGFYADGSRPWSALVDGLNNPKNGFEVKTEVLNAKPVGDERPFYRMYAESKTGTKLKIEFVVDSKRNVPVLFRSNFDYGNGKTRDMVWRGNWSFGGTHDKKEFVLPLKPQEKA